MTIFLRALKNKPVERTPVWLMRQAGRYLPEFYELYQKHGFMKLCHNPELAAEITLQPIRRFGCDAAILFSDILIVLEALGAEVSFDNAGPKVSTLLHNTADASKLRDIDPVEDLGFVAETVRLVREALPDDVSLIGFAGAPWTLFTYLVEGRGDLGFARARAFLVDHPEAATIALERLANAIILQLRAQFEAGVDAVQLFDSWTDTLTVDLWRQFAAPAARKVIAGLSDEDMPTIYFARGTSRLLRHLSLIGASAYGIDWNCSMAQARATLGSGVPLQGNLDPAMLLTRPGSGVLRREVERILRESGSQGHIFNLGHGVLPTTDPTRVQRLIALIQELSE